MRSTATLLVSIGMALGALALAFAAPGAGDRDARVVLASSTGAVQISNSRAGQAVFTAAAMRPGEGVSGTVRIGNSGDAAGRFEVRVAGLSDVPGPYGGRLSEGVRLVLFDVTDVHDPVTIFAGAPSALGEMELGTFAPGTHREYLVAATLPDGGVPGTHAGGDNRYQGSSLSLGFEWRAGPVPAPTPAPTPAPQAPTVPGPTAPTPGPTAPSSDPIGEALADALGLPSSRRCVSRRRFTIRLRAPGGAKVLSATVRVSGKRPVKLRGGRRAVVNLRGLRKGRVTVRVEVRASNGRTYRSQRTYGTCAR
jgi:hypothetical protein